MKRKKNAKKTVYFLVSMLLILVIIISGLKILEDTVYSSGQDRHTANDKKTIVRDGEAYFPRQDITVILVMGIDQEGPVQNSDYHRNPGAADMLALLVFDEKNEDCRILYLNRDTMAYIPVLGLGGVQAGTGYAQIALAHTYGSGLEDSCENTKKAVSDFLGGITIDYYISINMDAIPVLNDAVGGVTVMVEDDFSAVDPTITKGQMTLLGQQAMHFVRTRYNVGDQLNVSRIERQLIYVEGFSEAFLQAKKNDSNFVVTVYEKVAPYLVSDCSVNTISGMLSRYEGYEIREIVTPEGENILGKQYYEFRADEEKLDQLILRLLYARK